LPLVPATRENTAEFGLYLGSEVPQSGLAIPFYKGSVQEGYNFNFEYREQAVMRSARILKRPSQLDWLERHLHLTQLFVPLGAKGFILVLAPPNHTEGKSVPDLEKIKAFVFEPGVGFLLNLGTWHDFPFAADGVDVTVLTANSAEVVEALANCPEPRELFAGDVHKINIPTRLGVRLTVDLPA
jgi:ureidoglycolate lyase